MSFLRSFKQPSIIPGFAVTMAFTLIYLLLVVLIPLGGLFVTTATLSWDQFTHAVFDPRVVHSYKISFGLSLVAALVNAFFGLILAWVLVRYRFPGKRLFDAVVDLPFALPTAVAGIALSALYAPRGWIGSLFDPLNIKIAYTPLGIMIALMFVGLPFCVRTVEPILKDIDKEVEEAAISLGATRWQTFWQVILPSLVPGILTGFAMAFARGLGEYGSVIFIAGNIPFVSEISPLIIITKLEQYDVAGATAVASVMLVASFIMLFVINWLQQWSGARTVT
jgi:sulfate transport system permease protein